MLPVLPETNSFVRCLCASYFYLLILCRSVANLGDIG